MKRALIGSCIALALAAAVGLTQFNARAAADPQAKPLKALLVIGGCCHDYNAQKKLLTEGLAKRTPIEWTVVHEGDGPTTHKHSVFLDAGWSKGYDVVVHDECTADVKDLEFIGNILKPHREGLPAVLLHCAMHSYRSEGFPDKTTPWFEFTGMKTTGHGPQEPIDISFTDPAHPILKGLQSWTTGREELYNNSAGKPEPTATVLATGKQGNAEAVVAWTNDYHGTKVFATTLGHNNETVGDDRYLDLVARGLLWATGRLESIEKAAK